MLRLSLLFVAMLSMIAQGALGQTVYKQVDKDGKVTYTDTPPKKEGGKESKDQAVVKSVPVPIDSKSNLIKGIDAATVKATAKTLDEQAGKRTAETELLDNRVESARVALEAAKKARDEGQTLRENERYVVAGKDGQPGRIFPKPEYLERLKQLDEAVKLAEEQLAEAERLVRNGPAKPSNNSPETNAVER